MTYWCDDWALGEEQKRLDADQQRALERISKGSNSRSNPPRTDQQSQTDNQEPVTVTQSNAKTVDR